MLSRLATRQVAAVACYSCPACRYVSSSTRLPPPALDLTSLLESPWHAKQNLTDRKFPLDPFVVDQLVELEGQAKMTRRELQDARERRNQASKTKGKPTEAARLEGVEVKALLKTLEPQLASLEARIQDFALQLPNDSHPSSPVGGEASARTVATYGPSIPSPPPAADPALDHLSLTSPSSSSRSPSGWTDFPSSSLTSGASWPLLLHGGALLELALTQYAFSIALRHKFTPVLTPDVVRAEVAERCGFRPRDGEAQQTYYLSDGTPEGLQEAGLVLAGTAEVPLVAMSAGKTFSATELPRRHVALGRAFRAEAGARGSESRGLYRVHQFSKVEMVVVCAQEQSESMLEELRQIQEEVLKGLGLSLRVLDMPTEELGCSAHKKYDIEAWMPGRGKWGELSSASNCTDYQSRRLGIRYRPSSSSSSAHSPPGIARPKPPLEDLDLPTPAAFEATASYPSTHTPTPSASSGAPKTLYAHTLNATAAAIPRLIVALVENGAVLDGEGKCTGMRLPGVLRRFWLGTGGEEEGIEWVAEGEPLRQL